MKTKLKSLVLFFVAFALVLGFAGCVEGEEATLLPPRERLRVATTTSLYDTGLWGYLEPKFEEEYDVEMDILSVGTGTALRYGRDGVVDVVTIHDKPNELQFVADGYGVERIPFANNYFVIVGPPGDPAGIAGLSPADAFQRIYEEGTNNPDSVKFISRGDNSGTHNKEKAIWAAAGFDYENDISGGVHQWYIEAARGMGQTLDMANQMRAYTISDNGTFYAYQGDIDLVPLVESGSELLNVYSIIIVNPEKYPQVNLEAAQNLVDFLTSQEIQELIGEYGVEDYGEPLFNPCAGSEPTS